MPIFKSVADFVSKNLKPVLDGLASFVQSKLVPAFRAIGQLNAFTAYTDDEIWMAVERKRSGSGNDQAQSRSLKAPEWQVFTNPARAPRLSDFPSVISGHSGCARSSGTATERIEHVAV